MFGMSSPLVSVVTPVLNSAPTLELTLSSVAAQTYPNIEHIVVDGGSSDGTIDLLRRFRSIVPLRWISEPDSGMYAAINKGISLAQGDIVSYLNGDDLYMPWSIEGAVSALGSNGADLAFGDLLVLVKRGGHGHKVNMQFYPAFRPSIYAYEVNMGQPTVFWRRRVSDKVGGFDERMRYAGDFEYWLRTGMAGFRYTHIREVLAVAVEHERTLSTIHADELRQEVEQARLRFADTVGARTFVGLHSLKRVVQWRREALMLSWNLRRRRPSNWPNLIRFLRGAGIGLVRSSVTPLLLPLPLPGNWQMLGLDPAEFERKLTEELLRRSCSK